jgi:hypothetical protein
MPQERAVLGQNNQQQVQDSQQQQRQHTCIAATAAATAGVQHQQVCAGVLPHPLLVCARGMCYVLAPATENAIC